MKLTDLLSIEKWIDFEKEINKRSYLNACVFDAEGNRITGFKEWANRLCPAVKATENGQQFICSAAHQVIALQVKQTEEPVVEFCDAGLIKIAVPIFVNGTFMGVAGGCGLLGETGEIETYAVHKATGIDLEEVEQLADGIDRIESDQINSTIAFIQTQVDRIVNDSEKNPDFANG